MDGAMTLILQVIEAWVALSVLTVIGFNIAKAAVGRWTT